MIAWAGYEKYNNEGESNLNFKPRPRWPLDPNAHLINPIHQNIGRKWSKSINVNLFKYMFLWRGAWGQALAITLST